MAAEGQVLLLLARGGGHVLHAWDGIPDVSADAAAAAAPALVSADKKGPPKKRKN